MSIAFGKTGNVVPVPIPSASVFSSRIPHVLGEEISLRNPLELLEGKKSFNKLKLQTQLPQLASN